MNIEKLDREHFVIRELADQIREEWKSGSGQRDHEKRKYFYFTDVGKGDRQIYYHFHNAEEKRPLADKTLVLFRFGNVIHEDIQALYRKRGVAEYERDIEMGFEDWDVPASGRTDIILAAYRFIKADKGIAFEEIKTKNPSAFKSDEPEQKEIDQLLWNMYRGKESRSLRTRNVLDYGFILYVDRAVFDYPFAGWKIEYDQKRVDEIRDRFKKLKVVIDNKKLPKRCAERNSIECQYCRFYEFCWRGIPEIHEPEFVADETVEPPEMELVESMADHYLRLHAEIKVKTVELDEAREVLIKYFVATGTEDIPVNGQRIEHYFKKVSSLNNDYLLKHLKDKWHLIAKPQVMLIKQAIKAGEVDPEVFEKAKKATFEDSIRIKKGGANNADQKSDKSV